MESRKKKSTEKTNKSQKLEYEDILESFSLMEDEEPKETVIEKTLDSDDLALAELLRDMDEKSTDEDSAVIDVEENPDSEKEYESQNYTFFQEDIKETSDTAPFNAAEESVAEDSGQESPKPEFVIEDNQSGYASILSELVDEETDVMPAPVIECESEIDVLDLKHENIDDLKSEERAEKDAPDLEADRESALNILETSELPSLDESDGKSDSDTPSETIISEKNVEEAKIEEEPDFLGLSGIPSKPEKSVKQPSPSTRTDVLFDGVMMDFDDQIDLVTHAELLLAQGKRKEAAEIYHQLSENKGVTHWVSKRLRQLSVADN